MKFSVEDEPQRHVATAISAGVLRLVAPNPSRMTFHGTNTYMMATPEGVVVIDPGPNDAGHVADIVRTAPGRITRIILTHHHSDHAGAAPALKALTQAPIIAFAAYAGRTLTPDITVADGDTTCGMSVVHTPGHASDHICLSLPDGRLFSGDHVMAWATSVIPPPDGNMADYCVSLQRLVERPDTQYLPGHGPVLESPQRFVRAVLAHRLRKEDNILEALAKGASTSAELTDRLHRHAEPRLRRAAEVTILAHLEKLLGEDRVLKQNEHWQVAG